MKVSLAMCVLTDLHLWIPVCALLIGILLLAFLH